MQLTDTIWHRWFGRPYRLTKPVDEGRGQPVILLHGIGRSGQVWQQVVEQLVAGSYRAIVFDLLGFGASPKPGWLEYNVDDHARAVIASLERLDINEPVIIVGHSMGCLVAVRVARLRPELVKRLVLYEMPLYEGLPDKLQYRLRLDAYFKFYQKVIAYTPTFDATTARWAERLSRRVTGLEVDAATWRPFIRSLEHTVMRQTAASDLKQLAMPIDLIYGRLDMLVIRGKPQQIFGSDSDLVRHHTIRSAHAISKPASRFIVERIEAGERPETMKVVKRWPPKLREKHYEG